MSEETLIKCNFSGNFKRPLKLGIKQIVQCNYCDKKIYKISWPSSQNKNNFCSRKCMGLSRRGKPNWNSGLSSKIDKRIAHKERCHNWRGDNIAYRGLHQWIVSNYGKADKCNNREKQILKFACSLKSKKFEWAKLKRKRYERKVENYIQLCKSCHNKYDGINPTK